jgi:rare lipoprotein A
MSSRQSARRTHACTTPRVFVAGLCALGCGVIIAPAMAQTGGTPIPQPVAPTTGGTGYGAPGTRAIRVTPTALRDQIIFVRGTLPHAARRRIILQLLDPEGAWHNERHGRVRSDERFRIRWRPRHSGRTSIRVVLAPRRQHQARAGTAPIAKLNVYKRAQATYFGPGLYGGMTACGQILTPVLQGVANKTLPCGTLVALMYKRREVVVPVVDRGPFNGDYSLDLTQGTADALAFATAAEIGFIRLGP